MTELHSGSDLISRRFSGRVLEPREVFGPKQFRAAAQVAFHAPNTDTVPYPQLLASGADPLQAAWADQPWVTPVVGSGPIGFPDDFGAKAAWLPQLLVDSMRTDSSDSTFWDELEQKAQRGADPSDFVPSFVSRLVERRYGSPIGEPAGEPPHLTIAAHVVWVVVAAAQLTRTFHRMSLDASRPISRWGSEKAEISRQDPRWADLSDEYLPLLDLACQRARAALTARAAELERQDQTGEPGAHARQVALAARAIATLIEEISNNVTRSDARQVLLVHLEQLTDASWYLLAQAVLDDIDPGWSSLLLQLVLTQSDGTATGIFRPRWTELQAVADGIRDVYLRMTLRASERRRRVDLARGHVAPDLYDSMADVLWAESDAVTWALTRVAEREASPEELPWVLPTPVALVCSFDFEVEAALWRVAAERRRQAQFAVVMPVYVRRPADSDLGTLVWLEATITVPAGAARGDDHQALSVTSWRLLKNSATGGGENDPVRHLPVVVHLLGCPVLELPDLTAGPAMSLPAGQRQLKRQLEEAHLIDDPEARSSESVALVHAVTVDEVLAVRQTARDWSQRSSAGDNLSLPGDLFQPVSPARRYYTVLGVPMRDPAVRLRVTSVLARDEPQAEPGLGLFVNRRVDDEELNLMGVLGFNVVKAKVEEFSDSLRGYADWLPKHCAQIDQAGASHVGTAPPVPARTERAPTSPRPSAPANPRAGTW